MIMDEDDISFRLIRAEYYNYTNWSDSNPDGPIHTITLS